MYNHYLRWAWSFSPVWFSPHEVFACIFSWDRVFPQYILIGTRVLLLLEKFTLLPRPIRRKETSVISLRMSFQLTKEGETVMIGDNVVSDDVVAAVGRVVVMTMVVKSRVVPAAPMGYNRL